MAINISYFAGAGAQFFDSNGTPLVGGLLYVYSAGTTTPVATFTTVAGTVNNTNPIVLDAGGRTPNEIWLNGGVLYKFILKTSIGVTIGTYDNIPAVNDPTVFNNIITVTGTNTLLGTSTPPITAYFLGQTLSFVPVNSNTGATTIDVSGLGAREITFDASTSLSPGAIQAGKVALLEYDGVRFQLVNSITAAQIPDGSITSQKIAPVAVAKFSTSQIQPITASVASNALTLTLNPTTLDFRNTPLTSGTVNIRTIASDISVVVPSTATLGTTSAIQSRLMLLAIDNAGTIELAVVNVSGLTNLSETTLISTTAISASATASNVTYSTTARTSVPFRVVGYVESTQATAGTWATAPSTIQGAGGQALASNGEFRSIQVFTASGTYTRPAGLVRAKITVVGGGGGGGTSGGGGGGGGGGAIRVVAEATIGASQSVIIGNSGAAGFGVGINGSAGGTTSFGTLLSATGGSGGAGSNGFGGGGGLGASGDMNIGGSGGGTGSSAGAGIGGSSIFGGGGNGNGGDGRNYGGGGGGVGGSGPAGAGAAGVVFVEEFF